MKKRFLHIPILVVLMLLVTISIAVSPAHAATHPTNTTGLTASTQHPPHIINDCPGGLALYQGAILHCIYSDESHQTWVGVTQLFNHASVAVTINATNFGAFTIPSGQIVNAWQNPLDIDTILFD
jgi:hypothetical protein